MVRVLFGTLLQLMLAWFGSCLRRGTSICSCKKVQNNADTSIASASYSAMPERPAVTRRKPERQNNLHTEINPRNKCCNVICGFHGPIFQHSPLNTGSFYNICLGTVVN